MSIVYGPKWPFYSCFDYIGLLVSHPDSRFDPIGGSEPSSGCETQDWDSLLDFFFFTELVLVGMAHILQQNQNIISKELPPEWCPSKSIPIYRVPFTNTKLNFYIYKSEHGTYCDEPLLMCWPSCMRMFADVFSCTYTD